MLDEVGKMKDKTCMKAEGDKRLMKVGKKEGKALTLKQGKRQGVQRKKGEKWGA